MPARKEETLGGINRKRFRFLIQQYKVLTGDSLNTFN